MVFDPVLQLPEQVEHRPAYRTVVSDGIQVFDYRNPAARKDLQE